MEKKYLGIGLIIVVMLFAPLKNVMAQTQSNSTLMRAILEGVNKALETIGNVPTSQIISDNGSESPNPNNTRVCSGVSGDLRLGDSGTQVTNLSKILVSAGLLTQETSTFNNSVFQAVITYQERYASVILNPVGLTRGTGFVGPATRAYMNSHLGCNTSNPVIPTNPTNPIDVVGSGSGNSVNIPSSGSVKVLVLNHQASDPGIINTVVPISDFKISPKAGILVYGSVVDEYDGWAKVSVNGTDYPVAGPGSSVVVNGVTISPCTSCQNHDTAQLFHITVPTLPVSDGSDVTLKLYKSDTSKPPFIVPQTFKYYSNPTIPASDPYILPEANPNQSYNQPLISKIGSGNVNWIPHVIAGVIPRGFDVNNTSITYDPTNVYVKPNIGDIGMFIMWGSVGGQDVAQKFKLNLKTTQTNSPLIYAVNPSSASISTINNGLDVLILGQNLSGNGTKVEFKNSSGITKSATNFSVISANGIKARVPSLSPGSYTIQLTIDGMIALPFAGNPINETLNITQ